MPSAPASSHERRRPHRIGIRRAARLAQRRDVVDVDVKLHVIGPGAAARRGRALAGGVVGVAAVHGDAAARRDRWRSRRCRCRSRAAPRPRRSGRPSARRPAPPHMHLPPAQVAPSGQRVPQPPQLRMSLSRLTQPSAPQHDCPRLHLSPCGGQPQLPPRQMVPTGQTAPQSPQLRGSCVHVDAGGAAALAAALVGMRRADALADDARAAAPVDAAAAERRSHGDEHDGEDRRGARHAVTLSPSPVAVNARGGG